MLLEVCIAHLGLRVLILFLLDRSRDFLSYNGRTSPTMEPDIPSELDTADSSNTSWGWREYPSKLENTLERVLEGRTCPNSKRSSAVLDVLGVRIVERRDLPVHCTVLLHRIRSIRLS